jgi:hypothetical protein
MSLNYNYNLDERKLQEARQIARHLGIEGWQSLQISKAKGKRFSIRYRNKLINFGQYPYNGQGTFLDHRDKKIRDAWKKRHGKIVNQYGEIAYMNPESPEYYSWNILW